jgi:hypothetical protein
MKTENGENGTLVEGKVVEVVDQGALAVLNRSEIESAVDIANRYPRSIKLFRENMMDLCTLSEAIAEECMYALPRGEKTIEGPSVRFAEIAVHAWGNCRAGARVIDIGKELVTAQGFFFDVEKNVQIALEVKRRITDKYGRTFNTDMIGVTSNAASKIGFRNSVLTGIPKALWADPYAAARKTAIGSAKTLIDKRASMIAYFQKLGVSLEQICIVLKVAGEEDIGLEELGRLKGIAQTIKEDEVTIEQVFPTIAKGEGVGKGTKDLKDKLRGKKKGKEEPPTPAEKPKVNGADVLNEELAGKEMEKATKKSELDAAWDTHVKGKGGTEAQLYRLSDIYNRKVNEVPG